ncbi:sugar dehydrogenase complex small subunit [Bordetella genomosp. 13]|uniref:sugar dehydrogenase complex small subunit n=1 Tax=Bordetella genomosp. 13 TaxID=463040 RepID=UPI0011A478D9|nr:sugar dehydrogenase complex small subunit [Bordetella genomosp. 13]
MKDFTRNGFAESETPSNARRRALVKYTIAWSVLGGALASVPMRRLMAAAPASAPVGAAAATPEAAAFLRASRFLTSKEVSPMLAQRCHDALKKRIPDLDQVAAAINELVADRQLHHMDDYLALEGLDKDLDAKAKDIVQALYLGVVGQDEKAELFAYEEALMYDPTRDVLVVPTYGRGPNSWGPKPVSVTVKVEK